MRSLRDLQRALHLTELPAGRGEPAGLHGFVRGFELRVTQLPVELLSARQLPRVRLEVLLPQRDSTLSVARRETPAPRLTLGVPEFDTRVDLAGSAVAAAALLPSETRQKLHELIERQGRVDATRITLVALENGGDLLELCSRLLSLAENLAVPESEYAERIAINSLQDPDPAFRRFCLRTLARVEAHPELVRKVAGDVLRRDTDAMNRVCAAELLPREEALEQIANVLGSAEADASCAPLLDFVARDCTRPNAKRAIHNALRSSSPALLVAAVGAAAASRDPEFLPRLTELTWDPAPEVAAALVRALSSLGGKAASPALTELALRGANESRIEALRALGTLGTVELVEPLMRIADSGLEPRAVRNAAAATVRNIQERLTSAEAGQLSLTEEALDGAVSLAEPTKP
jgi:hypothetical protein